ncbi:selenium metabolism-associated LysR family transcriptional regulator [Priestia abyssalis]|uniref:selenium metabolism-associated LysR family transcriptional regulator n=1 Tax=Priestia abyssalis TaxID=1221450 RepID=UPI0009952044|nr:selenium metabolism-associated LysR family transcriptional regulator [Priestia abyssalis]
MNQDALRTFVTVVEEKNFTKAGEKLRLSQPSVSLHIKNLEAEFQTKLFDRSPKHLHITPSGQLLYDRAKQIVELYEKTKQDLLEYHHQMKGTLKIGASFTIGEYVLPWLMAQFRSIYPHVDFEVTIGNTNQINEMVRLFQVDIGLIEGQARNEELAIEPFMEDEMVVVAPKNHPLISIENSSFHHLQDQNWIAREKGSGTREYMDHFLRSHGIRVKGLITISSNQGVKEAVASGLGISLLSSSVVKRAVELEEINIIHMRENTLTRRFSAVYSERIQLKKTAEVFLHHIKEESE